MFAEEDLLPLSALADLCFCERRAALHFIEMQWQDNAATLEGSHLHQQADLPGVESRGDLRIARGLLVHSLRLGLSGKLDVVEFHRQQGTGGRAQAIAGPSDRPVPDGHEDTHSDSSIHNAQSPVGAGHSPILNPQSQIANRNSLIGNLQSPTANPRPPIGNPESAIPLPGVSGLWRPFPIEYKKGRLRKEEGYEVQLCAQALCLEEMLGVHVAAGAIYYGTTRRRLDIVFTPKLRAETERAAARLHELVRAQTTPRASRGPKCERCSLLDLCRPEALAPGKSARKYLKQMVHGSLVCGSERTASTSNQESEARNQEPETGALP